MKKYCIKLTKEELNGQLIDACEKGQLETVKYLLTSPELKKHANIHAYSNLGIITAYENGHLDVIKYLLTSPDLKEHVDIHIYKDYGFRNACQNGQLEIVKYLLTSPELKEHVDIHVKNDDGFKSASTNEHLDVVRFLIFDMNIKKTKHINKYLKKSPNEEVENMFNIRELNQRLAQELSSDKIDQKKPKL